jgi:hypothetical protein
MWLLSRLFTHADQPAPRFAFLGTVNWMRSLAILADSKFTHLQLQQFYLLVQRRQSNGQADALAYECLTMSMHNVSALDSLKAINNPYPIVRTAIVAWYYATYYAAKAMLAASSGTNSQTHASAAKAWQAEIVTGDLVKSPFNLSITGIAPSNVRQVIDVLRGGNTHDLNTKPMNEDMAYGAILSYLKGTAEYERWRLDEMIKKSREYKQGGFTSFRSNAARELRDAKLNPAHVNYLAQAFRYRGKANYRDAIYLSYGQDDSERLREFVSDLAYVARAFSVMAAHYTSKRVIKNDWAAFSEDLKEHARFEMPFDLSKI